MARGSRGGLGIFPRRRPALWALTTLIIGVVLFTWHGLFSSPPGPAVSTHAARSLDFERLPLSFEPVEGRNNPTIYFRTRMPGGVVSFTPDGVVLSIPGARGQGSGVSGRWAVGGGDHRGLRADAEQAPRRIRMRFIGSNPGSSIMGSERLPGVVNYFTGNDPARWHANLPTYGSIIYGNLYPGIDLRYEGAGNLLKGTYAIAPGADPDLIHWRYEGVDEVSVDGSGNLRIEVPSTEYRVPSARRYDSVLGTRYSVLTEQAPVAWQEIGGRKEPVEAHYEVDADGGVGMALGKYDHSKPLILDPDLVYSTYFGGSGHDEGYGIAVDGQGNAYVTGYTDSTDFPLQDPFQPSLHGTYDVYVSKLNPAGSALLYSTYLGGSGSQGGLGIAVDGQGNAYVTGYTNSPDFPLQDPFQPTRHGDYDAFVSKLNPAGSALVYSTYLGGNGGSFFEPDDIGYGIAVDGEGNAYVTGKTHVFDFPVRNPFQPNLHGYYDAFVSKFNSTGSALLYSTYLGGLDGDSYGPGDGSHDIAVDGQGNAYVTGYTFSSNFPVQNALQPTMRGFSDAFVSKFNPTGSALLYSTYLGGSDGFDEGEGIAMDGQGNAYVTGSTRSPDFPLQNPFQPTRHGSYDAFVSKLNPAGSALVYSSYLGGSDTSPNRPGDQGNSLTVDGQGNAYITGYTFSTDFPVRNAFQPRLSGLSDAFVSKVDWTGSALVYSSYLGGSDGYDDGYGVAVDAQGNAYVAGTTGTTDFPVRNAFQPTSRGNNDAFVTKIENLAPTPSATATATATATRVATNSPSPTATPTATHTATTVASRTATPTSTPTSTGTGTRTPTRTNTAVITGTRTNTPVITNTPARTQTTCTASFSDVHAADYFYDAVVYLACHGVISGYSDGTFRPFNDTTRGQVTKIIVLGFGIPVDTTGGPHFSDVPVGSAFYAYVETANRHGIVSGYGDGTFHPFADVTRGQLSKMVVLAAGWSLLDPSTATFRDVSVGSAFFRYVETAYSHGIISGYSCGDGCLEFRPGNSATRGQICKIVYQAIT